MLAPPVRIVGPVAIEEGTRTMKAMDGTIGFESEPGRTKFWIELRLA